MADQTKNGEAGQAGNSKTRNRTPGSAIAGSPNAGDDMPGQPEAGAPAGDVGQAGGADQEAGAGDGNAAADPAADAATDSAAGEPADTAADKVNEPKRRRSTWREVPVLVVVALAVALLFKAFVVQAFYIPSSSMENTLLIGDKILVSKLTYHLRSIHRGDIIVFSGEGSWDPILPSSRHSSEPLARAYDVTLRPLFHSIAGLFGTPVGQTDYVKRVIGIPGDHVACCNARGLVTVNGVPLHEQSYLFPGAAPSTIHFSITVPPGRLWVQGDYRTVSDDSRLRQSRPGYGTIPENKVTGRAFVIVWPPSHWRILPIPSTFSQPGINGSASSGKSTTPANGASSTGGAGPPELPLAAGLACAVPLTWLQRRARRRLRHRRHARRS